MNIPPNVGPNENYMGVVSRGGFLRNSLGYQKNCKKLAKFVEFTL
jgi:hypothetical protein